MILPLPLHLLHCDPCWRIYALLGLVLSLPSGGMSCLVPCTRTAKKTQYMYMYTHLMAPSRHITENWLRTALSLIHLFVWLVFWRRAKEYVTYTSKPTLCWKVTVQSPGKPRAVRRFLRVLARYMLGEEASTSWTWANKFLGHCIVLECQPNEARTGASTDSFVDVSVVGFMFI